MHCVLCLEFLHNIIIIGKILKIYISMHIHNSYTHNSPMALYNTVCIPGNANANNKF